MAADFDSPWKEALDVYFRAFLLLLFPEIHADIDWSRPVEMLDKEFQQLVPKAAQGRRTVDKLVKVWRKNGRAAWVLIHVEVQAHRDRAFTKRMCVYNCRIFDSHDRDVASLAVLADDDPNWRPRVYRRGLWGCSLRMTFPPVKLLDYAGREAELEASDNPFAKVVLAHLKTLETRDNPNDRRAWKVRIARGLSEQGFPTEEVQRLTKMIDWLMELPTALERDFWRELHEYEEGLRMPYVTTLERLTMLKMIERGLRTKFGEEGAALIPAIEDMFDAEKYMAILDALVQAKDADEVRQVCAKLAAPPPRRKKGGNGKRGAK
ncbi:MAG TPA: hypothetical protein VKA46_19250 [Gemmataceae bacterium]|nr:hypothetical protein [Gemmataceae bacterium]